MTIHASFDLSAQSHHTCDNCGVTVVARALKPIADFFQRVEPGGMVPSGECPACSGLCYPSKVLRALKVRQKKERKAKSGD